MKDLIAQLEGAEPDVEMYDAKIKVLSEYVKHHVKEEKNEMFPRVTASSLDMVELGARMATRKDDLLVQASLIPLTPFHIGRRRARVVFVGNGMGGTHTQR